MTDLMSSPVTGLILLLDMKDILNRFNVLLVKQWWGKKKEKVFTLHCPCSDYLFSSSERFIPWSDYFYDT